MLFFFFNDTTTTEIYTLSLHDALPILAVMGDLDRALALLTVDRPVEARAVAETATQQARQWGQAYLAARGLDRKSTRLNSSHANTSYAVFCLKKNHIIISRTLSSSILP